MRSPLSALIDSAERRGKLNLRTADIARSLPGVSAEALRQALARQQRKGRIVRASRGSQHWVIVPLQDAHAGAPPLESWLDAYLSKGLEQPYYVALLSAAEVHGSAPQAVMVTQLMVPKTRRPVQVGRHQLVFLARAHVAQMPTQWHETPNGRFTVSTPELTALELVSRQQMIGGISRVIEVLQGLTTGLSARRLTAALNAVNEVPTAQRLGLLFARSAQDALADSVGSWLHGKRTRIIALSPGNQGNEPALLDHRFKVLVPATLEQANT